MRQTHLPLPAAVRPLAYPGTVKALMLYTMLSMVSIPVYADTAAYPGATATAGTALNNVVTAGAPVQAPAPAVLAATTAPVNNEVATTAPNEKTGFFGRVVSSISPFNSNSAAPAAQEAPAPQAAATPNMPADTINSPANAAIVDPAAPMSTATLGEPDSSPALFAARQEIEAQAAVQTPLQAPVQAAVVPAAAPAAPIHTIAANPPVAAMPVAAQSASDYIHSSANSMPDTASTLPAAPDTKASTHHAATVINNETIAANKKSRMKTAKKVAPLISAPVETSANIPVAAPVAAPAAPAVTIAEQKPAVVIAPVAVANAAATPVVDNVTHPINSNEPIITAAMINAEPAIEHVDVALGAADDSPAKFNERRELTPVKDPDKISKVLTSLLKPITSIDETAAAQTDPAQGKPLASYDSPGAIIKTESLKQAQLQPDLTESDIRLASLNPAAGDVNANSNTPLIQLPAVPPPVVGPNPDQEVLKPKTTPAMGDNNEPRRELSPASKAIANRIPSHLGQTAKQNTGPIDIDHAKSPRAPEGSVSSTSVKHEEMGIKIEVKSPKIDLNYELEKAYNAVNAGQTETAMEIYKNILANDPNNKSALFALGTLYHRAGQLDSARKLYSKLLSLEPNNRDALNNFLVLMADEAPEAALEQLSKLEQRDPKFSPIPAQMAIIYEKMGNMDMASEKMFRAIDLAPENLLYRYNLAIMLDKQQKFDEAGKLYRQIVDANMRGETTPGNIQQIQQRLIYISSAKPQ